MDPLTLLIVGGGIMVAASRITSGRGGTFPSPPLRGELNVRSPFGPRAAFVQNGITHAASFHAGVDLRAAIGTEALALDAGTIEALENGSAGKILRLRLDTGERVSYIHLSEFKRSKGERVAAGDVVALTGDTGAPGAPHLHLEIRPAGATTAVDPAPLIGV